MRFRLKASRVPFAHHARTGPDHDLARREPHDGALPTGRVGLTCPVSDLSQAAPRRLAAIAWQLYAEAGLGQAEIERLHLHLAVLPFTR